MLLLFFVVILCLLFACVWSVVRVLYSFIVVMCLLRLFVLCRLVCVCFVCRLRGYCSFVLCCCLMCVVVLRILCLRIRVCIA